MWHQHLSTHFSFIALLSVATTRLISYMEFGLSCIFLTIREKIQLTDFFFKFDIQGFVFLINHREEH